MKDTGKPVKNVIPDGSCRGSCVFLHASLQLFPESMEKLIP